MPSRNALHSIKDAVSHVDVDRVTQQAKDGLSRIAPHEQNLSDNEKKLSILGGSALGAIALTRITKPSGWLLLGAAAGLIIRGSTGYCSVYHALGVDTKNK